MILKFNQTSSRLKCLDKHQLSVVAKCLFSLVIFSLLSFSCNSPAHRLKKDERNHQVKFCLSQGTLVRLPSGKDVLIENLKSGDTILAYDRTKNKYFPARILKTYKTEHDGFVKLNFDSLYRNGVEVFPKMSIIVSKDHPIWVQGKGWCSNEPEMTKRILMLKEVQKYKVGDVFYTNNDSSMEGFSGTTILGSIEKVSGIVSAYSIMQLENNYDCFVANGIVVGTEAMTMENGGE